ncbi:unnamed protein product [Peronospora belbahrii]|uniref:WRKY19-like zinc finger domain-containing protein n=1 Tax=Peronospora belbahrii TaxID=622444 RepID=A0ABN8CPD3_9STRA|nr:unnamed protein product [Peronospora belbahrii]
MSTFFALKSPFQQLWYGTICIEMDPLSQLWTERDVTRPIPLCPDENKTALAFILNPSSLHTSLHGRNSACVSHTISPLYKTKLGIADLHTTNDNDFDVNKVETRLIELRASSCSLLSGNVVVSKRMEHLLFVGNQHHGKMRVRKSSICSQNDCLRAAVSRGRCVRHGGGSRCTYPNCTHGARLNNRCFHHGGCKLCKITGCTSKAKRYGYCWSHGGGHICDAPGCSKVAAPGGFCWAHGGGNRCKVDGCNRRSYQKHNYLCKHHNALQVEKAL